MSPKKKGKVSWGPALTGDGCLPGTLRFSFHLSADGFQNPIFLCNSRHYLLFSSFLSYEIQHVTF